MAAFPVNPGFQNVLGYISELASKLGVIVEEAPAYREGSC